MSAAQKTIEIEEGATFKTVETKPNKWCSRPLIALTTCLISLSSAMLIFYFLGDHLPLFRAREANNPQKKDFSLVDLGEATIDDNVSTVWGPAVGNMRRRLNASLLAHDHTMSAIVHTKHGHRDRRLSESSAPSEQVTLHVALEYANRSDLPPSAVIVDAHDDLLHFDLRRPDERLEPWECDATSCRSVAPASAPAGRALRGHRESIRWICGLTCDLTCTYATRLVEEAFVTWACEPLADYICADLSVVVNASTSEPGSGGPAPPDRNFCRQAVLGACGSELPLSAAVNEMTGALTRHFEREHELGTLVTIGVDFVGTALDYALAKLDEVTPDEWGIANSTYYLFNQRWVERVEQVCENVCTEACSRIVIAIVEWISNCFPADAPVRTLGASGAPQLTRMANVKVGDLVQTPHGFEPVVFQGHAATRPTPYVVLRFDSGHTLELSPDHYFKRVDAANGEHAGYLLAKDVEVGMAAAVEGAATHALVVSVETAIRDGAYNPYTPSGEIVVADVHASCHSSWLLEGYASLVPPTHVPAVYQAMLAPVRAIHRWAPRYSKDFAAAFEGRDAGMGEVGVTELLKVAVGVLKA